MFELSRYLKKHGAIILIALVLLFGQAILDLSLPNRMSDIVNVGIQKGGIEDVAPKALPGDMMQLFQIFMTGEQRQAVQDAYTPYASLTETEQAKTDKTFPDAQALGAFVFTGSQEQLAEADTAFSRAGYAFMNYLSKFAQQGGVQIGESNEVSADFDFSALSQMMPMMLMQMQQNPQALQEEVDAAQAVPDMMTSAVMAVVNKGIYGLLGADTGAMQTAYIAKTGGFMLLISLLVMGCAVGAGYCFSKIGAGVARDLRRDVYAKVSGFTNAEMDNFSTASLITRTTNDVNNVQMMYTMGMRMLVYAPLMGVGGVIMAVQKSLSMSWIIALAVGVLLMLMGVLFVVVVPRFKKMQGFVDRLSLVARENLSGIMVVRAFSNQKFQEKRFDDANKDLTANSLFVQRAIATLMPLMMLIMNMVSLLIIWTGANQIADSALQVGDMMAFMQYSIQIMISFVMISMIFVMMPRAAVSAARVNEVLKSESIVKDPQTPAGFTGRVKGVVRFENVAFRYQGAQEDVLQNISFTALPGEVTAFIGSTGSGKSTLVNLIPRFYDVTAGCVTLDGMDVRDITQHDLRENIGYVPQKGLLFSGTIESNLRYGGEDAAQERLREAVEVAQAAEFVDEKEEGLASAISQGGTNVSGGQRQRLAIARALVKKAPVYIFDDTFSALDYATDARLRKALRPYTQNAAVLIVAQRVATIMHAEKIIVLDEGRIVGAGTHTELLKTCPAYREIAESQLTKEELA